MAILLAQVGRAEVDQFGNRYRCGAFRLPYDL